MRLSVVHDMRYIKLHDMRYIRFPLHRIQNDLPKLFDDRVVTVNITYRAVIN